MRVDADQPADVAVADQHQRQPLRQQAVQPLRDALAKSVEPRVGGGTLPAVAQRHRLLAAQQVHAPQRDAHRLGDRFGVEPLGVQGQRRRDHWQVAQRQRVVWLHEDGSAADLDGVLRGADDGGADALVRRFEANAPGLHPLQHGARQLRAEVAVVPRFAVVDVFGYAAGEAQRVGLALMGHRRQSQQRRGGGAELGRAHGVEQVLGHALDQPGDAGGVGQRADAQIQPHLTGEPGGSGLDALHPALRVKSEDARADVDGGEFDDRAGLADRDLGGAPANVDIHHPRRVADRARCGARAKRSELGLERVAGADSDETPGLRGKQVADGARVAAPYRHAGQDQRAAVDLLGPHLGQRVLALDEGLQRRRVDAFVGGVGREQHLGLVHHHALGDDIAVVQPLKQQAREDQVRGRRPDVDADADQDDLVLELHAAPHAAEEYPAALARAHAAGGGALCRRVRRPRRWRRRWVLRTRRAPSGWEPRSCAASLRIRGGCSGLPSSTESRCRPR